MSSPRWEEGRPRAKSVLSFTSNKSNKSHRSSGSKEKMDLTETSKDKKHLHTKADPNLATNEAQPAAIALEASNLGSLRGMQLKDIHGNPITDPDRSNPTRHRFERPLDTIRGFEEAWSGSYNNRRTSSYGRGADRPDSRGTGATGDFSRRSSGFFPGYPNNPPTPQGRGFQDGGYYGNRNSMARPDSFVDQSSGQPQQFQGQGSRGYRPNPRTNSDPMLYGGKQAQQGVYPSHGHQPSYDTIGTSGSHQTDPWGNSTDPSSENSSLDRIQPMQKVDEQQQMKETYGIGFGGNQQIQLNEYPQAMTQTGHARNGYGPPGPSNLNRFQSAPEPRPMPPPKAAAGPRVPIKLDSPSGSPLTQEVSRQVSRESTGKRKSWLMRRFSKNK